MGVIVGPHGIRGDVKVKSYTAEPEDLFSLGTLYTTNGAPCNLKLLRIVGPDMLIAHVEGVDTRNAAESLKGIYLYVERAQLPPVASDNEYYYHDLEGLEVKATDGTHIGTVQAVNNYGAGDFLEIMTDDDGLLTLPFTKEAVLDVKLNDKLILINPDFLFG